MEQYASIPSLVTSYLHCPQLGTHFVVSLVASLTLYSESDMRCDPRTGPGWNRRGLQLVTRRDRMVRILPVLSPLHPPSLSYTLHPQLSARRDGGRQAHVGMEWKVMKIPRCSSHFRQQLNNNDGHADARHMSPSLIPSPAALEAPPCTLPGALHGPFLGHSLTSALPRHSILYSSHT